jgi:uncharacterized phage protein (TIGR02218 family)
VSVLVTTHDKTLVVDGESYTPLGGTDPSAIRRNAALEEADVEHKGMITSYAFVWADFNAGKYSDCEVTEKRVDSRYAWMGSITTTKFWISTVKWDGEAWECGCTALPRWLRPKIGDVFGRNCRHKLGVIPPGGTGCGANLASFTVAGVVVTGMLDGEKRRVIRAAGLGAGFTNGYFGSGDLTFTSGQNAGVLGLEIKTYVQSTRDIELQLPAPYDILPGDVFTIVAGCDKLGTTCVAKFNQFPNFGGFPDVPGVDRILRVTPQG